MSISWSLPRIFIATPVWRVRTDCSLTLARPAAALRQAKPNEAAAVAPAAFDRSSVRALVEAGYMPLSRYVELFDGAGAGFGEGEV